MKKIITLYCLVFVLFTETAFAHVATNKQNTLPQAMAPLPDLIVESVQWTDTYPYSNCGEGSVSQNIASGFLYMCITIKNIGNTNATLSPNSFEASIYKGSIFSTNLFATFQPGSPVIIIPGATATFSISTMGSPNILDSTGTFLSVMRLDIHNAIKESSEFNNFKLFYITVMP